MREPLRHLTPSEVRKRTIFQRQVQLATQDDCAWRTLRNCLEGPLPVGSLERTIAECFVHAVESGEFGDPADNYLTARRLNDVRRRLA
jgi:hypothetical protein